MSAEWRWRLDIYMGSEEPATSIYVQDDMEAAVRVRVALQDERTTGIEFVRTMVTK